MIFQSDFCRKSFVLLSELKRRSAVTIYRCLRQSDMQIDESSLISTTNLQIWRTKRWIESRKTKRQI